MNELVNLYNNFPFLLAQNKELNEFKGFIQSTDGMFEVELRIEEFPFCKGLVLSGTNKTNVLINSLKSQIMCLISTSKFLNQFLIDLRNLINCRSKHLQKNNSVDLKKQVLLNSIIQNLSLIGWNHVFSVNEDFSEIILSYIDEEYRHHYFTVLLNDASYKNNMLFSYDLPEELRNLNVTNIAESYEKFKAAVNSWQDLWNVLREIDQFSLVIEPTNPEFKHYHRRIAISKTTSLLIYLNKEQPYSYPEIKVFGPNTKLSTFNSLISGEFSSNWSNEETILSNLQRIFKIKYLLPNDKIKEIININCGICFMYNTNDNIPNCFCSEDKCGISYHNICIFKWLSTLPHTKQSLKTLCGVCPNCKKPITCEIPD